MFLFWITWSHLITEESISNLKYDRDMNFIVKCYLCSRIKTNKYFDDDDDHRIYITRSNENGGGSYIIGYQFLSSYPLHLYSNVWLCRPIINSLCQFRMIWVLQLKYYREIHFGNIRESTYVSVVYSFLTIVKRNMETKNDGCKSVMLET